MELYDAMKNRRTRYAICSDSPISDEQISQIIKNAVQNTPSAFNSQSSRVVLLLNDRHLALWSIVLETLRAITPPEKFETTEKKIKGFAAGHGTLLFFEDTETVKKLQAAFPTYSDNFPIWSQQSGGMLQYAIWTALSSEGLGASLQHYNPLIDAEVEKVFHIPESFQLLAQMPFGQPTSEPDARQHLDINQRVFIKR